MADDLRLDYAAGYDTFDPDPREIPGAGYAAALGQKREPPADLCIEMAMQRRSTCRA